MIRNNIKHHNMINNILIWIASVLLLSFLSLGYLSLSSKTHFHTLVHNIRQIEINLFELTTFTKRMILEMDDSMQERILDNKKQLNEHLNYLKIYANNNHITEIKDLENELFDLFSIVDKLIVMEKNKKQLMANIQEKITYIDKLLEISEKRILNKNSNDIYVDLKFYQFDIILSKIARDLGVYLKTDDAKALFSVNKLFIELIKQKQIFKMMPLSKEQKNIYEKVLVYVEEKNKSIHEIINVHQMKIHTLKRMGALTDKLDKRIGKNLKKILLYEEGKSLDITFWTIIMFIGLFVLLIIFFIFSKRFLFTLSSQLVDGFGQVLNATKQIANNTKISNIHFDEKENEFQAIGQSMIMMQKELFKSNLSKEELENLLDNIGDFRCVLNSDETLTFTSKHLSNLLGYEMTDTLDASILGEYCNFSTCKALIKHNLIQDLDWHIVGKNREYHSVHLSAILLSDTSLFIIGNERKVDSVHSHESLTINGLVLIDGYGNVCDYNTIFAGLFNLNKYTEKEIGLETLLHEYTMDKVLNISTIKQLVDKAEELELTLHHKDTNEKLYLFVNAYELFSDHIRQPAYALKIQDMTRMVVEDEHTLRLAHYDSLTGLLNRASFFSEISTMISVAHQEKSTFGLLIISLTKFREVNDVFGYEIGDKLLVHIGKVLRTFFGEDKSIARLGGDEFSILCKDEDNSDQIAFETSRLLDILNTEVTINGHLIYPKVYIGVSIYPHDGKSSKVLLREANIALAQAKSNSYGFAFPDNIKSKTVIKNIEIAQSLPKAFKHNEFELLYQPQVNSETNTLVGVEALIRWNHPTFGQLSPALFIPIAEETGMINDIGIWVFTEVCKQIKAWGGLGKEPLKVAVNIAAKHFETSTFVDEIIAIVETYAIDPSYIQIEITESQLQNIDEKQDVCHKKLVDYGFSVAIDDFGTGFSSLVLLRKRYIDTIKIDKYFIDDIELDSASRDLLSGILSIAKVLNLNVIIEGAENKVQIEILTQLGFHVFQGYYFSKPLTAKEIIHFKILGNSSS